MIGKRLIKIRNKVYKELLEIATAEELPLSEFVDRILTAFIEDYYDTGSEEDDPSVDDDEEEDEDSDQDKEKDISEEK